MILDALAQLALLACGFALLSIALVLGESVRVTWQRWRAEQDETRACERLDRQQRVSRYEALVRDVIAERRR